MMTLDAAAARDLVHGSDEIAFLDLREVGQFGEGHALTAVPVPYTRLEMIIGGLVPRLTVPVLLTDAGDGIAQRAAGRLASLGYRDIRIAGGGMPEWAAAGFPLYKGVNVPSKMLGELAEALWHPTMMTATDLAGWQRDGRVFGFFDTRPAQEYHKMHVPGAVSLPNGELAHRLETLPRDLPLVLTCAGRTRGIIGAIGLAVLGERHRVLALENGTQGWALSGGVLVRGVAASPLPMLDAAQLAASRARASGMIARWKMARCDAAGVAAMRAEPSRTTYMFDVRSAEEAAADPVPAATHALGVQLVQATDQWIGVRRARLVLCCDTGLRAAIAAFWLHQLGFDVAVAEIDDALRGLPSPTPPFAPPRLAADRIAPTAAREALERGARLIDLRSSHSFREEHVAGATWACRPRLDRLAHLTGTGLKLLLVSESEAAAGHAAHDLRAADHRDIAIVEGGHPALVRAGCAVERSPAMPPDDDCIDFLSFVHDRHDGNLDAMRRYLDWETGLVAQLDEAERAEYRLLSPAGLDHATT